MQTGRALSVTWSCTIGGWDIGSIEGDSMQGVSPTHSPLILRVSSLVNV